MGRLLIALLLLIVCISSASMGFGFTCKEAERNALLNFKHSFLGRPNRLSSWVGKDCCGWKGVGCDNNTGNVIMLDLGSTNFAPWGLESYNLIAREVNPVLLELKYLSYLDLSFIDFNGSRIPGFFGSMTQLQHLNLSGSYFGGEVPHSLGNLTKLVVLDLNRACTYSNSLEWASKLGNLQYLDLSRIDLSQAFDSLNLVLHNLAPSLLVLKLAEWSWLGNSHQVIRNLTMSPGPLQHLDLSFNFIGGQFPHFIQNLSSIRFLDLSFNEFHSSIPSWLGNQIDLKHLNLRGNYFTGSFPSFIQNFSSIEFLHLSGNEFSSSIPSWLASKKDLKYLGLSGNSFNGPFPQFLQNSSFLTSIDLSSNQFSSSIPSWLANKTDLEFLSLNNNQFDHWDGGIMNNIGRLCSLKYLDLSYNSFQEEVFESQTNFSRCTKYDLEYLCLANNNMSSHLPIIDRFPSLLVLDLSLNNLDTLPLSLEGLSFLEYLDLSSNHFSTVPPSLGSLISLRELDLSLNNLETLPPSLGGLSFLEYLNLSYNHLSVVHQVSLANLSSLNTLDISSNSIVFDVSPDWMPPFQLQSLYILPCKLNSTFPRWLLSQEKIFELDLSDTGIFGPLPNNIGNAMPSLWSLRLANNHINGSIPRSLCDLASLSFLDLQKNRLSGMIPDCWANSCTLQCLSLNDNSLQGELPISVNNCKDLMALDVGKNILHGEIPSWNGANFATLQILILRENRFKGIIPSQLCSVRTLQIIDLAKNNLSGTIPQCFGHFEGMGSIQPPSDFIASPPSDFIALPPSDFIALPPSYAASAPTVDPNEWSAVEIIKGEEREYTTVLHQLVNMDLSCNNLVGVIPTNLTSLSLLRSLNLSHNHFTGIIPKEIGKMKSLESLDLSSNDLSGSIPESISSLNFLSKMNLSFNNLQGQIPTGSQLQVLDDPSSIYIGNPGLCGDPLPKKCFGNGIAQPPTSKVLEDDEEDNKHEKMWFYLVIMLGFASGFWGVIGILVVKRRWRHAYFWLAEEIGDWLYVRVALVIARAKGER